MNTKLKSTTFVLLTLLINLFFASCNKDSGNLDSTDATNNFKFPEFKGKQDVLYGTQIVYPIIKGKGKLGQPFFIGENNKAYFNTLFNSRESHLKKWDYLSKLFPLESYDGLWTQLAFSIGGAPSASAGPIDINDARYFRMNFLNEGEGEGEGHYLSGVIHEMGHILTLNDKELDPSVSNMDCKTYRCFNGCFKVGAFGDLFYTKFYKNQQPFLSEYEVLKEQSNTLGNEEFDVLKENFYNKYPDMFLDSYCLTDFVEDLAVTFDQFIEGEKPTDNTKIKNKKVLLFYQDDKMVELKNKILENIKKL
jgi:hypothetical protein